MKENPFMDSYRGIKRQKIMGLVEEGLLKERNLKHYCRSTRPEMWSIEKTFNPSVVYVVLLTKQLHILFQNAQK